MSSFGGNYEQRVAQDPDDYRSLYNVGVEAFRAGKLEKAWNSFNCLKEVCSDKNWPVAWAEPVYYNAGNTEVKLEKYEDAIASFESVIRYNPGNEIARKKLEYAKKMRDQEKQKQDKNKQQRDDADKENEQQEEKDQSQEQQNNQDKNESDNRNRDERDQSQNQNDDNQSGGRDNETEQDGADDNSKQDSLGQDSEEEGSDKRSSNPDLTEHEADLMRQLSRYDEAMNEMMTKKMTGKLAGGHSEQNNW